jgi:hypothetical protein
MFASKHILATAENLENLLKNKAIKFIELCGYSAL